VGGVVEDKSMGRIDTALLPRKYVAVLQIAASFLKHS